MTSRRSRILYLQYANPAAYPPIDHSARMLAEAGCEVLLLGTAASGDPLKIRAARLRLLLVPSTRRGWRQKAHYVRFALSAAHVARRWRPDWIYVSDPLAAPVGLLVRMLARVSVVYHEHDAPASGQAESTFMALVLRARAVLVRAATLCVVPNAARGQLVTAATGRADLQTVWNCPRRAEVSPSRQPRPPSQMRVLFHGGIGPAPLPITLVDALATLPDGVSLVIVGYETPGHLGYSRELHLRAQVRGIDHRIEFLGPVNRDRLLAICATCDVGLAAFPTDSTNVNERHLAGASNKAFEYLACGLPLLVGREQSWHTLYVDRDVARSCEPASIASLTEALQWFFDHPLESRAMGERGRQMVLDGWNYETTFRPVLDRMLQGAEETSARDVPLSTSHPRSDGALAVGDRARGH